MASRKSRFESGWIHQSFGRGRSHPGRKTCGPSRPSRFLGPSSNGKTPRSQRGNVGSTPIGSTNIRARSSFRRAPALQAGGGGGRARRVHHADASEWDPSLAVTQVSLRLGGSIPHVGTTAPWCNGSISGFDPEGAGSNPAGATNIRARSVGATRLVANEETVGASPIAPSTHL